MNVREFLAELKTKIDAKAPIDLEFGKESVEIKTSNLISFINYKKFEQDKNQVP